MHKNKEMFVKITAVRKNHLTCKHQYRRIKNVRLFGFQSIKLSKKDLSGYLVRSVTSSVISVSGNSQWKAMAGSLCRTSGATEAIGRLKVKPRDVRGKTPGNLQFLQSFN